jgi:hypothetical protein
MLWAPGSVWKLFQLVRSNFGQFGAGPVSWSGLTAPRRSYRVLAVRSGASGLTALCMLSRFLLFVAFCVALLHWFRGCVIWLRGRSLHM